MIHRKISYSKQLSRVSLLAKLLFTWMIPNTDDLGRMEGEPEIIKGMVLPYENFSNDEITKALKELHNEKLIIWYEVSGNKYIQFPNFHKYQVLRKDREHISDIPPYHNNGIPMADNDIPCHDNDGQKFPEEEENKKRIRREEEEEEKSEYTTASADYSVVIETFNQNIHLITPIEAEKINDWLKDVEPAVVIAAIGEAITYNKRSWGYINKVLNAWFSQNIKTKNDVDAYLRDRADQKGEKDKKDKTKSEGIKCPTCNGTGWIRRDDGTAERCPDCNRGIKND